MYARSIDEASARLRELRHDECGDFALASLALGLALAATRLREELALPLALGGLVVWGLGMRAVVERWSLVDRLVGERDALVIPEIHAHATREATPERRRSHAARLRDAVSREDDARIAAVAEELNALADELDDGTLELDLVSAVACSRLLTDVVDSPLLNRAAPVEDLRSRVNQIRSGLRPPARRPASRIITAEAASPAASGTRRSVSTTRMP